VKVVACAGVAEDRVASASALFDESQVVTQELAEGSCELDDGRRRYYVRPDELLFTTMPRTEFGASRKLESDELRDSSRQLCDHLATSRRAR
jgi:hypothetical protein